MTYANRVNLQGYLEITEIETVRLDGKTIPVIHGYLHNGEFLSKHRLLITDAPASLTVELLRDYQDRHAEPQVSLQIDEEQIRIVPVLQETPLVAIEGRLLSRPNQESVIDVKWITFLSVMPSAISQDKRLEEIARSWSLIREQDKESVYQYVHNLFQQRTQRPSSGLRP